MLTWPSESESLKSESFKVLYSSESGPELQLLLKFKCSKVCLDLVISEPKLDLII